jgi:hypothetical protein
MRLDGENLGTEIKKSALAAPILFILCWNTECARRGRTIPRHVL